MKLMAGNMRMDELRVGNVIPRPIYDIHINKDPLWIPIALNKLGIYSMVFACENKMTKTEGIPKIVCINSYGEGSEMDFIKQFDYALKLNRRIREERINVLIFYYDIAVAALIKMLNPHIKIIYRVGIEQSSYDELPYPKSLIRLSLLLASAVSNILMVYTKDNYDTILAFAPFTRAKLKLIRHGIPESFFIKRGEHRGNKKVILCVARIAKVKRHDLLIQSFSKLQGKHPDWNIHLVGPIEDKEYFNEIKRLTQRLGLSKKIKFLKFISDKEQRREYLNASIFCLCSSQEGSSAARTEAMAMGIPIITTATGGSHYVKGRGIVVPIGDEYALTGALDKFMSSPEERDRASKKEIQFANQIKASKIVKEMLSALNDPTAGKTAYKKTKELNPYTDSNKWGS